MDSLGYGEPVELIKDGDDVITGLRVDEHTSSRVPHVLVFIEDF